MFIKIAAVPAIEEEDIGIRLPGPNGPYDYDDKGQSEISQIFISEDEDSIWCIRFQYVQNGSLMLSNQYGACDGSKFHTIQFNYPSEFLVKVSGKYAYYAVKSITFTTNKGIYGPYGCKDPNESNLVDFTFDMGNNRQFGGFHGDFYENGFRSIGVYIKPNNRSVMATPENKSEDKSILEG